MRNHVDLVRSEIAFCWRNEAWSAGCKRGGSMYPSCVAQRWVPGDGVDAPKVGVSDTVQPPLEVAQYISLKRCTTEFR